MGRPGTPALGGTAGRTAPVEPGEETTLEGPGSSPLRRWSQALHNRAWRDNETQQAPAATAGVQIWSAENVLTFKDSSTAVEQCAQRACVESPALGSSQAVTG